MSHLLTFWSVAICASILGGCATPSGKKHKALSEQDRVDMYLQMASASLSEGDATNALLSLEEVNKLNSKLPVTYYYYSMAYYSKGELKLAETAAQTAIKLDPHYSQAKNTLGKIYLDENRLSEAEPFLMEASKDLTNRDANIAETNLGILYFKKTQTDKALYYLNKVLETPSAMSCIAAYYRGQIELGRNDLRRAQLDFDQASKSNCAQNTSAHLALGKTLIRQKRYDVARAKLVEIRLLFPMSDAASEADQLLKEIP